MKIISKEDFFNGVNFKQKIPYSKIQQLMNQNGDFIIRLCELMGSRKLHCAAAVLLSSKALECQLKVDKLATAYLKAVNESENFIIDEDHIKKAKIPLQKAEINIIKSIDYNFGSLQMPYQDLHGWLQKLGKLDPNVYEFTRAIIIDFHKTGITLMYKSYYTTLAALILANYFFSPTNQMVINSTRIHGNIYEEDEKEVHSDNEEYVNGLPPSYLLKLPSWNPEKIKEFIKNKNKEKDEDSLMELEQSEEERQFIDWVYSFNPKIKLTKLYGYLKRKGNIKRNLIQLIMKNQQLVNDIKNQLIELKDIIKSEEPYETYNYGGCFSLNDKSYKQFEKFQKLNNEIGKQYEKIIYQELKDSNDSELIKTEQYLDQLLKQQEILMNKIKQNIRSMSLSQLITKNILNQNLYMVCQKTLLIKKQRKLIKSQLLNIIQYIKKDKNIGPHQKEAEKKFKDVSEAYQVLSDKQKRNEYDNPGQFDFNWDNHFHFRNGSDLFKDFFSKGFFDDEDDADFFGKDNFFNDDGFFSKGFGMQMNQGFSNFGNFGNGGGGMMKSVSKQTQMRNGKRVSVTTTTITKPDGTKTVEKVEEIDDGSGNIKVNKITDGKGQKYIKN